MLLRNLDPNNGHINGSRYIVLSITKGCIHAILTSGPKAGNTIMIPRIRFQPKQKELCYELERLQFPVRLCFAITANKSQVNFSNNINISYITLNSIITGTNIPINWDLTEWWVLCTRNALCSFVEGWTWRCCQNIQTSRSYESEPHEKCCI